MTDHGELHVIFGTGAVGMSVMDELIRTYSPECVEGEFSEVHIEDAA
jgi:hypothetical protein